MNGKPICLEQQPSFGPFDQVRLAELIRKARHPNCVMAEIGCWLGQGSTQVFIRELKGFGRLISVDTFKGSIGVLGHETITRNFDAEATFRHNVKEAGGTDMVDVLVGDAAEAANQIPDHSLDLVFIDSDHRYSTTIAHIAAWRHKVKPGGIICGHDCEGSPKEFDYKTLLANREQDAIPGGKNFLHVHAGCVLAVSEAFGNRATLFAHKKMRLPDRTPGRSSIWFIVA